MRNHAPPRPPPQQATSPAYLGLEGSNPHFLFLLACFLLLMPLLLYRPVVPRPCLVPNWRLCICGPVPHFLCNLLSFRADSHLSSLPIRPCVPMLYKTQ